MDSTTIIIVVNLCINGGYILIKLGNAFIAFGKSLKDPNKKALKKQNKLINYKLNYILLINNQK